MDLEGGHARPAPLPPALAEHQSLLLLKLSSWMQVLVDAALPDGLRTRHWMTLSVLHHSGPRSQQAVAQKLRIDKGTMVAVVTELEARGYVTRDRDPADRRTYRVRITDGGAAWLSTTEAAIQDVEDEALSPLSATDRERLLHVTSMLFEA